MTIEQDLVRAMELLVEEQKATDEQRGNDADMAWIDFQERAVSLVRLHGHALLSALAYQRRLREAITGKCVACDFENYERPTWHVIDDRDAVPLTLRGRVAIVPLDQEGE